MLLSQINHNSDVSDVVKFNYINEMINLEFL
jgi:hypothetical protein